MAARAARASTVRGSTSCRQPGVFSLRTDGFGWADAAIVYEELGRASCPAHWCGRSVEDGDRDRWSRPSPRGGTPLVEHLDALDTLLVLDRRPGLVRVRRASTWTRCSGRLAARSAHSGARGRRRCPRGRRSATRATGASVAPRPARCSPRRTASAWPTGWSSSRSRTRRNASSSTDRSARSRRSSTSVADMVVRVEVARAAVYAAACVLDDPTTADLGRGPSPARSCSRARRRCRTASAATQVFGGMGFTWEVDVHLYLKRAWVLDTRVRHRSTTTPTRSRPR